MPPAFRRGAVWLALAGALAAAGCARDVHVRLPHAADESTGTITVVLTRAASDLTVAVNGHLVAQRAHTDRVRVDGVGAGMVDVDIAAGAGPERLERSVRVLLDAGGHVSIPVGSPDPSMGSAVKMGMLTVVAYVLSRAIVWAL